MEDFAIDKVAMRSINGGVADLTYSTVAGNQATREGECSDTYSLYTLDSETGTTTCSFETCEVNC
jgi:hypothetical protein